METIPSESEFKDHILEFHMSGIETPFLYEVPESEYDRALGVLGSEKAATMPDPRFFCFDTKGGLTVAVSLRDVDLIRYFWEPLKHREHNPPEDVPEPEETKLYFRGRAEPFVTGVETPEELFALAIELDGEISATDAFIVFPDESGEQVAFNANRLVLFEAPTVQISEGRRISLGQDGSGDEDGAF
ncbi:MAG: hypothetical protein A3K19_17760 [Lentisphaerae bacterium RIFOXYB12_FULL_65_16]|nr:MAG: hypothetical protein A3K18_14995 [Lentisphaerae bacterium RIFOXYA12_64_32]OGV85295.1 MAG: hypothetical protein A3K19_17760 [Lentisphaerae bacterium RIFOXYB12_FULL_65_16]